MIGSELLGFFAHVKVKKLIIVYFLIVQQFILIELNSY